MPAALDTILVDYDSMLEVCVEIDSAKRSDGTLKTWYFSTDIRETGAAETPANTTFLPFIVPGGVLGPITQSLTEDGLFSGLAQISAGTLTLLQRVMDVDLLSDLQNYVFSGYEIRIKLGRHSDLYASFQAFRSVSITLDPTVQLTPNGLLATFQLSSIYASLLSETVRVDHYVGIPTCGEVLTTTAVVSASYNAAHDLLTFTVMGRFRVSSLPAANRNLIAKVSSSTNSNFVVNFTTGGLLDCSASIGGVAATLHTSAVNLADGAWHSFIWSLADKTTSYLMIDKVPIGETIPSGSVNLPNVGVRIARFIVGKYCDFRIYNRYIPPDEATGIFSVRSDGLDLGCVACWRFDDNAGSTVNDYSTTNADGTWTGTINTDFKWSPSDLGEPEIAGSPYPISLGNIYNAKAHTLDAIRERYRLLSGTIDWGFTTLVVKSQGTILTNVTDYQTSPSNEGIIQLTSQEAEPITFDISRQEANPSNLYPSTIAYNLITGYTTIPATKLANYGPLWIITPWDSGFYTDQEITAQQGLAEILGSSNLYYTENEEGKIWFDYLIPPTGYGPYTEPCLDLRGRLDGKVDFGNRGGVSGSCAIACWVKVNIADQTGLGSAPPNEGTMYFAAKNAIGGNYALYFQATGSSAGKLGFQIAGVTLESSAGFISPYRWYFLAAVFDISGDTMKLYLAEQGSTLVEIASKANTGTPTTNSSSLVIGGNNTYPWFSVQHLQVWTVTKSLAQLQTLMTTPPVGNEANLSIYAPINEGTGSPKEIVSNTTSTISASGSEGIPQWAPKLIVNLNDTPSIKLEDLHYVDPSWNIIINYIKNRYQMSNSDIDAGVSQNDRLKLTRPSQSIPFESSKTKERFKRAKKIVVDSPLMDRESATRLLRAVQLRFGTDNMIGTVKFPPGLYQSRLSCGLALGDEIGIVGSFPSKVNTALSFRVVLTSPNPLQLSNTIAIWR